VLEVTETNHIGREYLKSFKYLTLPFESVQRSGEKFLFFAKGYLIAQIPVFLLDKKQVSYFNSISKGFKHGNGNS
jgi:hypothetical protein